MSLDLRHLDDIPEQTIEPRQLGDDDGRLFAALIVGQPRRVQVCRREGDGR
jgi:hypothetical protein